MVRAALVALAPAALAAATAGATVASSFSPGLGHAGCVKVMTSVCGADWKTKHQLCVDCVTAHMSELEPNCTQQEALNHCDNPPGSSPAPSPSGDLGCVKRLTSVCGEGWKTNHTACVDCVTDHLSDLEPNCTQKKALYLCNHPPGGPPGPSPSPGPSHVPDPPAPPAPPATPRAGAPQPHLILFVVDDQGAANVGFK
jgi:hypothetical protein